MTNIARAVFGLGLYAAALVLTGVLYHWLPATAGVFGRLVVSANLVLPLFAVGLLMGTPSGALGRHGTRRLLLGIAVMVLAMAREAAHMRGTVVPPMVFAAGRGVFLLLLVAMAWSWWQARHPSAAEGVGVR